MGMMDTMLVHFKCKYDHTWDHAKIARDIFGDHKHMVVNEKLSTNPHCHFHGYTDMDDKDVDKYITKLASTHYQRQEPGGETSRPVKRARKDLDELGFQYLAKEHHQPLVMHGISEEELASLRAASDEHVQKLKNGMRDHVWAKEYTGQPQEVHVNMRTDAFDWYIENNLRPGPRFQKDVLWFMATHPKASRAWKLYASERI